jgi:predicted HAD superfamily phosphohydrolase YqeG
MELIVDLDNTLIDTRSLEVYRKTNEGREFIKRNLHNLSTRLYDVAAQEILRYDCVTIVTNNTQDEARLLMRKHGLQGLDLIASADKPNTEMFEDILCPYRDPLDVVLIGDDPRDMIAARKLNLVSIGGLWGSIYLESDLLQAGASVIAHSQNQVAEYLHYFQEEWLSSSRHFNLAFNQRPDLLGMKPEEMVNVSLGDYYPWGMGSSNYSKELLSFKKAKDETIDEINNGAVDEYYNGGRLKWNNSYKNLIHSLGQRLFERIEEEYLEESITLIAAPNSLPSYCYKLDLNHKLVCNAIPQDDSNIYVPRDRVLNRVEASKTSHCGVRPDLIEHYRTISVDINLIPEDTEHVIIFDDIRTNGVQLDAISTLIRQAGYSKKLSSMTLGQTVMRV